MQVVDWHGVGVGLGGAGEAVGVSVAVAALGVTMLGGARVAVRAGATATAAVGSAVGKVGVQATDDTARTSAASRRDKRPGKRALTPCRIPAP